MQVKKLWLGSQSPRRLALVGLVGQTWHTAVADVDEDVIDDPDPVQNVLARAKLKGAVLRQQIGPNDVLLTADTTVAIEGTMLNKPAGPVEARQMLRQLRGRWHEVHTGMVLYHGREVVSDVSTTAVLMRPYSDDEIEAYIATGDPLDKAGAYAIQHPIFQPVARLEGCYLGVMGLSVCRLVPLLAGLGVDVSAVDLGEMRSAHVGYVCETWTRPSSF